ncbi:MULTISPECIES: PDGLE domain-containing protein [Micromonospora]|uniref:Cobalamin biosynthesis protein CbiM n=1 Tax=Micromonospora solifontis TaxID=2487138 RepID=A0ABX9W848_9ACTN|nr:MULTISPECIES: PDGLE domain-containing protein [Micromonospora]NES16854.1 cobalamin biosynthesis protein CbiM [Micromonospora sp. PPF5-17B]NES39781.1 cobalamin biosynthesis protein CbiM [Micromonospora solifontis]NES58493.1 cobalamin biosynthesis protein CbiM [Micromonospora sp. PPF5-6]RNL85417.1 cobalamin biosynthesis protein CbiM [Micromonospora solifontis]
MSRRSWPFVLGGLLIALLLAGVVSNYASAHPDGLDSSLLKGCTVNAEGEITGGSCPAQKSQRHELSDSPLADYGVRGISNGFLSTGLSGVLGVLLTFALGGGLFWLARRRGPAPAGASAAPGGGPAGTDRPASRAGSAG